MNNQFKMVCKIKGFLPKLHPPLTFNRADGFCKIKYIEPEEVEDQDYSDCQNFVVNIAPETVFVVSYDEERKFMTAKELAEENGITLHKLGDLAQFQCVDDICSEIYQHIIAPEMFID